MEYKFIVNTEDVNSYGYRIITDGIDISQYEKNPVVLFMHNRGNYNPTGDEVIGKARLAKENNQLLAYITFDSENEFAAKIEKKVQGDFIRMCSMFADVVESSADQSLILQGQRYETVTKCKLVEISIVDIGGNDDAIRLSADPKNQPKIKLLNTKRMSEFKTIALALGQNADTDEAGVLKSVNELKLAKENSDKEAKEWKDKFIALQRTEATALVDKAVSLGLIPEDLKDVQVSAFDTDFDGQKAKLSKLIEAKETENKDNGIQGAIGAVVGLAKGQAGKGNEEGKNSFDYLQKHNPVELARLRDEEPKEYAKLCADFAKGVRFKG